MLMRLSGNLLNNLRLGKQLDIHSHIKNGQFIVSVRDYGLGISRTERKHIFKPFYRIEDRITEGVSGTGIGLTIARQQAEHLGGSLNYVDVDNGACFELKLPLG